MGIDFTRRPVARVLNDFDVNVGSDGVFKSWRRLKQSVYREGKGWGCGSDGRVDPATGEARRLGNFLVTEDAEAGRNFLDGRIGRLARERVRNPERGEVIEEKRLWGNLLTSQAMCFNLFLPQKADLGLAGRIWSEALPGEVGRVTGVGVEHSPGRRHATLGIGDKSAFDAVVRYERADGRGTGLLAIETKYTDCFSPKGKSNNAYRSIPGTSRTDVERAREAMVWSGTMTEEGFARVRGMRTEQLWRTQALAETLRLSGDFGHVTYVVLHAAGDPECAAAVGEYEACLTGRAREETRLRVMTWEELVGAAEGVTNGADREWAGKFWERYLDWGPVERECEGV